MTETPLQKVAFLDTNMLHFVGLYLGHAKKMDLFPFGEATAEAAVESLEALTWSDGAKESLQRGLYLLKMAREKDFVLRHGWMSELELIAGRVRGQAMLNAATEGIPDRMWSHFHFMEKYIRDRMDGAAMRKAALGVKEIADRLDHLGLSEGTSSRADLPNAVDLASKIVANVYMEVADSIIYASAIFARADILFTSDAPLRETVNLIRNPGTAGNKRKEERFWYIHDELRPKLAEVNDHGALVFPSAHSVTPGGVIRPDIEV